MSIAPPCSSTRTLTPLRSLKLTGREVAYDDEQHAMDERAGSTHRISDETSQIDRTSKHTLTDFEKVTRPVAV